VQRKNTSSLIIIRDKAEGMNLDEMGKNFITVGNRSGKSGERGFMGRGAKDCTALGEMEVESIKDEKYYKCKLTTTPQFIPLVDDKKVNNEIRKSLKIEKGNGTVITLNIMHKYKIPRIDTNVRDLPWHYALRDILSEYSATNVLIRNINQPDLKPEKAVYRQPEGELVCDEKFEIPGYKEAFEKLKIWKSDRPFDDLTEKSFRKSGFIIKAKRAIHECSLLYAGFEKDPYAQKFFGRLECYYIDKLLDEYDERLGNEEELTAENPQLLIDPNRQSGLYREHPFTKALLKFPTERLKALINIDKKKDQVNKSDVVSAETKNKLNDLAKAASKYLTQQVEDLEELTSGESVDKDFFTKKGVLIYPTYFRLGVGEVRKLTYYLNRKLSDKEGQEVEVVADKLTILDTPFKLEINPKKKDMLKGTFRVKGDLVSDSVLIKAICPDVP